MAFIEISTAHKELSVDHGCIDSPQSKQGEYLVFFLLKTSWFVNVVLVSAVY